MSNDTTTKSIIVDRSLHEGQIVLIGINRPNRRNAVDRETAKELAQAFRDFEADPIARVAILHGIGGNFCSGADLQETSKGNMNRIDPEGDAPMGPSRLVLTKPTIACIAGFAVAGGLELALLCDLRIASTRTTLGVFCRRFGVPLIDGGSVRLPRIVGLGRALDLTLTGRPVSADEAERIGLVTRVVPHGTEMSESVALAKQLCEFPQLCMRGDRKSIYESCYDSKSFDDAMKNEFRIGALALQNETVQGAKRFAGGQGRHGNFSKL